MGTGHKWWVIYPDGVSDDMVECDPECSNDPNGEIEAIDWFASIGMHARRTSFGNDATPMHVLQKPGETIYMPSPLVHAVLNMDTTTAITR